MRHRRGKEPVAARDVVRGGDTGDSGVQGDSSENDDALDKGCAQRHLDKKTGRLTTHRKSTGTSREKRLTTCGLSPQTPINVPVGTLRAGSRRPLGRIHTSNDTRRDRRQTREAEPRP
jgi:hypothetical protein